MPRLPFSYILRLPSTTLSKRDILVGKSDWGKSFMNGGDKKIVFWPATYDLDDDVPAIDIGFKWIHNAMYVDEIELPKETKSTIMLERNSNDEIGKIQVVDPENFLAAKCTDNIEVNGYNVKQLVREALDYFQKADNPYENAYL